MAKLITVIARAAGNDRADFQRWLLHELAPRLLQGDRAPSRLIVNLVDVMPPAGAPGSAEPPYDVVVEAWLEQPVEFSTWLGRWLPDGRIGTAWAWHVRERIQLDDGLLPASGQRSPGVKVIYLVRRLESLSNREAAERWREHAPRAREHHAGMAKYVQNGVLEAMSTDPAVPVVHGIAELHFRTYEDLEQRMYDSPAGREAIAADTARLVAEATPLYTSEYVLRPGAPREAAGERGRREE